MTGEMTALAGLTPAQRTEVILSAARAEMAGRLWRAALGGDGTGNGTGNGAEPGGAGLTAPSTAASTAAPRYDARMVMQLLMSDPTLAGVQGAPSPLSALAGAAMGTQPAMGTGTVAGIGPAAAVRSPRVSAPAPGTGASILAMATGAEVPAPTVASGRSASSGIAGAMGTTESTGGGQLSAALSLGVNQRFSAVIASAAQSSGIPAPALAAIIDAEAARGRDGSWNTLSRNPRSSAAGLGQFLSGTWTDMAQRRGTWLNSVAAARGWLDDAGRVRPAARGALLQMRYDAEASIRTIADFARMNIRQIESSGIPVSDSVTTIARAAYLGHHLGMGDARRFLAGGLPPARARMLLHAQVGTASAERRIAQAGNPTEAHRQWLLAYIDRRIRPERFVLA